MIVMTRVGRGWIIWVIRNGLMITVIDENDRWNKEFLHVGGNIYTQLFLYLFDFYSFHYFLRFNDIKLRNGYQ